MISHQESLKWSVREGMAAQVMVVIMDFYAIPFALFLGANPKEIGFLAALPILLGAFFQLFSVKGIKLIKSRRQFLILGVGLQALFLIPIGFLALNKTAAHIYYFIGLATLYRIFLMIIGPIWGSLMSEYLSENERGSYFGRRSRWVGVSGLAALVAGGWLLFVSHYVSVAWGFTVLFLAAAAFRIVSFSLMFRMKDIPISFNAEHEFTFLMFIRRFRESNYLKFVIYVSAITFATYLSAPFFSVLMIRDLRYSYLMYMAIILANMIGGLISFPIWGRHSDYIGNARILKVTGLLIPFIPILWIFSGNVFYVFAIELLGGFIWGGFNLCATNFIFEAAIPEKRVRVLSYFNLFTGMAIFSGSLIGGFLADKLPPLNGHRLYTLFIISGGVRLLAYIWFSPKFLEVRKEVRNVSTRALFYSVVGLRPFLGRNTDLNNLAPPPPVQ